MKVNDFVEFVTPRGEVKQGKVISVYTNTSTGKQMVSIKVDTTSSFNTFGIEIDSVVLLKSATTNEGRLRQLEKSLHGYEVKRSQMIESGEALKKKGTFQAIENKIALRKQQIAEFLATH